MAAILSSALLVGACSDEAQVEGEASADAVASAAPACADDGPRLPLTGLCASRAVNYLNPAEGGSPETPDGCEWAVEETELAGGNVLLYRGLRCGDKTTRLAWSADSESAQLAYESSALGHRKGDVAVIMAESVDGSPGTGPQAFARAAIGNPLQAGACTIRKAGRAEWPDDAVVIDTGANGSGGSCGPYGFDPAAPSFWREFQHQSWFFRLGSGQPDIDPGSFTLLALNDETGNWEQMQ